jgi:hypothetical protein
MQNQPSTRLISWLGGDDMWQKASTKNFDVNATYGGKACITGKPRGDQKMMIIAFGEQIIFLGLVGLSAPGRSHCCSQSIVSQNQDSSPVRK